MNHNQSPCRRFAAGFAAATGTSLLAFVGATLLFAANPAFAQPQAAPPPTPKAEAKAKLYDETLDARTQIAAALASAKKNNRRVLIQWGGNWCPWCIRMHDLMQGDKAIAKVLQSEYDLIHVDCGRPNRKNVDLAQSYGARIEQFPFLTLLDVDGKPLANQDTRPFELDREKGHELSLKAGHDPKKVLKFLEDYKVPAVAADALLNRGLAEARRTGKRALVHFGGPGCIWCRRLEAWMARPDVAPILAKDFVAVKIDIDRSTGGKELLEKHAGSSESGVPWIAFLDADGKNLADSNGPKGNVGFPAEPAEIEHFKDMLRKAAVKLSPAEIDSLAATLKAARPAEGSN